MHDWHFQNPESWIFRWKSSQGPASTLYVLQDRDGCSLSAARKRTVFPLSASSTLLIQYGGSVWGFVAQMENAGRKGFRTARSESAWITDTGKWSKSCVRRQKREGSDRWGTRESGAMLGCL